MATLVMAAFCIGQAAADEHLYEHNVNRRTGALESAVVLEIRPEPGLLQRRFYDAKSFLLRWVETTDYRGHTAVYEFDDFRTLLGYTYPESIAYRDGHPENEERTRVKVYERVALPAEKLSIPQGRPLFDMQGRQSVTIPAEFAPEGIIVRVTIGGRGLDFQLDSGAAAMVLDAGVARELGLPISNIRKGTFSGEYTVGQTRMPQFALGDLTARNVAIEAIPFSRMVGERKVVGLLGGDFFASARIEVNFKNHTLRMLAPTKAVPANPWVSLPIEIDDLVPRVHAKFNSVDGAFTVDLGADDTMLFGHYFKQFHPNRKGDVYGQVEGIAGRGVDYHRYTFSRFDFGQLAFADAGAIVANGNAFEETDYDGLLGRDILANFNLILDYPNQKLYVDSMVQ